MHPLARKAAAEFTGTAMLTSTVVGAGITAERLAPADGAVQLLAGSLATSAMLAALVMALGPVSAAFNPVITLAQTLFRAVRPREALLYIAAQITGAVTGAAIADIMFELPALAVSGQDRSTVGIWLGEAVGTLGLMLVVFGVIRAGRQAHVAYAVAAYILAASWFTSSGSFANPAITAARALTDTSTGIAPRSVPVFILMQLAGAALGFIAVRLLYPDATRTPPSPANTPR